MDLPKPMIITCHDLRSVTTSTLWGQTQKTHRMAKEDTHGTPLGSSLQKSLNPRCLNLWATASGHRYGPHPCTVPSRVHKGRPAQMTYNPHQVHAHTAKYTRAKGPTLRTCWYTRRGKPQDWLRPPPPEKLAQHSRLGERCKGSQEQKVRGSPASAPPSSQED